MKYLAVVNTNTFLNNETLKIPFSETDNWDAASKAREIEDIWNIEGSANVRLFQLIELNIADGEEIK